MFIKVLEQETGLRRDEIGKILKFNQVCSLNQCQKSLSEAKNWKISEFHLSFPAYEALDSN